MKTNITMLSEKDRNLFGVVIRQETQNGFLCLTDLQEAYTHARILNGWHDKKVQSVLRQKINADKVYFLLKERNLIDLKKSDFDAYVKKDNLINLLKSLKMYKCYGRGENKAVFCDKYIWLLICQEMNNSWYSDVIQYLFTGKFSMFDFVEFDASEYEMTQQARLNHEKAWKYFYPEGEGKAKPGYCLHHIDPDWRYNDKERYNEWNPKDLQMLTNSEHLKLHQKIGYGKSKDLDFLESSEIGDILYLCMKNKLPNPNYSGVSIALNKKVFGRHELGIRNKASKEELAELRRLEDNIAFAINKGWLKTNDDVIDAIAS